MPEKLPIKHGASNFVSSAFVAVLIGPLTTPFHLYRLYIVYNGNVEVKCSVLTVYLALNETCRIRFNAFMVAVFPTVVI
jgi:hypothetical protein